MGNKASQIAKVLGADADGAVLLADVNDWLQDPKWKQNPVLDKPVVRAELDKLVARLEQSEKPAGKQEAKRISREELTGFFKNLSPEDLQAVEDYVLTEDLLRRGGLVKLLYEYMDRTESKENKVNGSELAKWVLHEGAFQTSVGGGGGNIAGLNEKIKEILVALKKKEGEFLTLGEVENYFSSWTARQLRIITADLMKAGPRRLVNHQAMLDKLDPRRTGLIEGAMIEEWLKDETFANNSRLLRILENLQEKLQQDKVKSPTAAGKSPSERKSRWNVTRDQLDWWLNTLHNGDFNYLARNVLTEDEDKMLDVLELVFDAMDTNEDGFVSRDEVLDWVKNEKYFAVGSEVDRQIKQENILKRLNIEVKKKEKVSLKEMEQFFDGWSLNAVRQCTEDLVKRGRIREVFKALDTDKKSVVSHEQIKNWIQTERFFQRSKPAQDFVLAKIEPHKAKGITLLDLQGYFSQQDLPTVRRMTEDVLMRLRDIKNTVMIHA